MRKSDIFNAYAQIMKDKGLLKTAYPNKEDKEPPESKEIYDIKPNGKEDHIMEQAHKDTAVVSNAHDKFNGIVENELQRQNMDVAIARRNPSGTITGHTYVKAKQNLVNSLVRAGFMTDAKNKEKLSVAVDKCAENVLEKKANPLAFLAGPAGIAIGAAALVAAIYYINHSADADQGVLVNIRRVIAAAKEAEDDIPNSGEAYNILSELPQKLTAFEQTAVNFQNVGMWAVRTEEDVNKINMVVKNYKDAGELIKELLHQYLMSIEGIPKSQLEDHWEITQRLLDAGKAIIGDDIEDLKNSINGLIKSLDNSFAKISAIEAAAQSKLKNKDFMQRLDQAMGNAPKPNPGEEHPESKPSSVATPKTKKPEIL